MIINENDIRGRIKAEKPEGFYIIAGEEDYLKKHYLSSLKKLSVSEDDPFALFNLSSFDGDNVNVGAISEAVKSPPMMGEYKFIEWKHANLEQLREDEKAELISLAEARADYPYAVLVIVTLPEGLDTAPERRGGKPKIATRLAASGFDILDLERSTDSKLLMWAKRHFDAEGIAVTADTVGSLIFRVGHSMELLNNEINKLCYYAKANGLSTVDSSHVSLVCVSSVECDAFTLSNAILEKDMKKAFAALSDFKLRRVEPTAVIAMLERTYSELASVALLAREGAGQEDIVAATKLHPYTAKLYMKAAKKIGARRLSETLEKLVKIDARAKSGGISGFGRIEMFIAENV